MLLQCFLRDSIPNALELGSESGRGAGEQQEYGVASMSVPEGLRDVSPACMDLRLRRLRRHFQTVVANEFQAEIDDLHPQRRRSLFLHQMLINIRHGFTRGCPVGEDIGWIDGETCV